MRSGSSRPIGLCANDFIGADPAPAGTGRRGGAAILNIIGLIRRTRDMWQSQSRCRRSESMSTGARFECAETAIQCQRVKNECSRRESNPGNKLGRLES